MTTQETLAANSLEMTVTYTSDCPDLICIVHNDAGEAEDVTETYIACGRDRDMLSDTIAAHAGWQRPWERDNTVIDLQTDAKIEYSMSDTDESEDDFCASYIADKIIEIEERERELEWEFDDNTGFARFELLNKYDIACKLWEQECTEIPDWAAKYVQKIEWRDIG